MLDSNETIVAIASPTTPAMRGIVRMSGQSVVPILESVGVVSSHTKRPQVIHSRINLGMPLGEMDVTVSLWPTSQSYTGQPSAELHTIGSAPVLQSIVSVLSAAGARAARPGEFTMRAFLAGRLDLPQAEAVLGVIEAEQRGSLEHALKQLAGNLSRPLEQMRSEMLDLLADVEAGLDFVDEDIEFISDDALVDRLSVIHAAVEKTRQSMESRGGNRARAIVAFRGNPNAGKSHLINALVGREVAIVADVAGTTRDVVSVETVLGGNEIQWVDTAGIESRAQQDPLFEITAASQAQALRASQNADVRIWCVDASNDDLAAQRRYFETHDGSSKRSSVDIWVATKSDLIDVATRQSDWIYTSVITGEGVDQLRDRVSQFVASRDQEEVGSIMGTAARCSGSLAHAATCIETAIRFVQQGDGHEFVASELRVAVECLGEVTGTVYTDDILDRVFGRFCIGK
ncbi:tRNA modification GTPase TrmE [Rhodopirellula maiorica SM1]|uniref:tRNA modification GTPase MnmE n=1 Tax=Rhodopirellula maiorica SM1 TaxID=1265738 RepID=M5S1L8_9BACT|nr:GTPase [Rhodopirellula maiorica]EMI20074.1 tRNA modification GTPase TrmE [Rhodopirellula maiorica SM1]